MRHKPAAAISTISSKCSMLINPKICVLQAIPNKISAIPSSMVLCDFIVSLQIGAQTVEAWARRSELAAAQSVDTTSAPKAEACLPASVGCCFFTSWGFTPNPTSFCAKRKRKAGCGFAAIFIFLFSFSFVNFYKFPPTISAYSTNTLCPT